jgi:hypothetical protein
MSISIDQAFVRQFQNEVHESYQRLGSRLRATVRSKTGVRGISTTFAKVGRGIAASKARHGAVPVMTVDHTAVECFLSDHYAGDWIDKLDELKVNIDERGVIANAGAYALGRKTDELIIAALDQATRVVTGAGDLADTVGLTRAKVLAAFEMLGNTDVPDDGQRVCVVGWKQWSDLLGIQEFANTQYVGESELPWKGAQMKRWLGTSWVAHSGLPLVGNVRQCFWYHRTAIAHAVGADVTTDITWHGDRAAFFVNNMMSQGAVMVDADGIVRIRARE